MGHQKARMGMMAFDDDLMLRPSTEGSLTTTGTCEGLEINETPADGVTAKISVPARAADTELVVKIQAADTDSDASYETIAQSEPIDAVGVYGVRFATQRKYVRPLCEVAGTTPDFGATEIGIVPHGF
jgi:hypothetical protein